MPRSASVFKAVAAGVVLALAAASVSAAGAAAAAGVGDVPVLRSITVIVDGRPAEPDFAALVSLAPGEALSLPRIDASVKQLYRTGLFSDIQVWTDGRDDAGLTFFLERRLTTRAVEFHADKGVPVRRIRESVYAVRPDGPYSEEKKVRAENEIRDYLRREGYLNCVVGGSSRRVEAQTAVDVLFEIVHGPRFTLREIGFKGRPAVAQADLQSIIQSRPGRPYNPAELDADMIRLKTFYNTLGYPQADIEIRGRVFHESDNSVSLDFMFDPKERIVVEVRGASLPVAPLQAIWEERVFEDWAVERSEAKIVLAMRTRGYLFATVHSSLERKADVLRVIHDVSPGEKIRIKDLLFEGNSHFSAAELKRALNIGPRILLAGGLDGAEVFEFPDRVVKLYETQGYAETLADLNFRGSGRSTEAVIRVTEGPRRMIVGVTVSGAKIFPSPDLLAQTVSAAGKPYNPPDIRRDVGRLETYYLNRGVRETKIAAAVEQTGENRFTVEFRIQEGRRVRIERILIAGSVVTRRPIIEREIRVREGDFAGAEDIQATRRGLEKLGVFSEVRIEEVPTGPETENLVINLREGQRNLISVGAGLETKNEPMTFNLGKNVIGPRATAEFIRGNMFGRAAQLSLISQFSQREKRAVVSWEQPFLFGLPIQTTANVWLEREERESYGFDRRGFSLSGSNPLAKGWVSLTTLRLASTTLYFLEIEENEIDRQHYPFSATSISETLLLDRRDDSFNPERGFFFSAVLEWAYPLFRVESDYIKSYLKYQAFFPVFSRWNFGLTARAGLGMGRIPIHERFFAGGSNSFRGEPFDHLGPEDPSSDKPVGGKATILFNFEVKFPLSAALPALSGAVFFDIGNVFIHRSDFSFGHLENALGLGLRYKTPFGPVRFDLAWNLSAGAGSRTPLAFITIGNVF